MKAPVMLVNPRDKKLGFPRYGVCVRLSLEGVLTFSLRARFGQEALESLGARALCGQALLSGFDGRGGQGLVRKSRRAGGEGE